jgi:hypothetical protein
MIDFAALFFGLVLGFALGAYFTFTYWAQGFIKGALEHTLNGLDEQ